jgi:hypothetical protein
MGGWADAVGAILPAFFQIGGGMIMNHQVRQDAKKIANDEKARNEQYERIALLNQQTAGLQNQGGTKEPPKSNTALYIGLGVGGVVVLGVIIFAVTRK